jgi:hypothetical protein
MGEVELAMSEQAKHTLGLVAYAYAGPTPGHWEADVRMHCWAIRPRDGEDIVYVYSEPGGSVTNRNRSVGEMAANARLIAAAPCLLAACEDVAIRLAKVCAAGGSMQDFLDAGSVRELLDAIGKARWGVEAITGGAK